jgi:hypothetical protein
VSEISEEEKAIFRAAAARRTANSIRLKRVVFSCDENQAESLSVLLDAWVTRFGKQAAIDHLIRMWGHAEARLKDRDAQS